MRHRESDPRLSGLVLRTSRPPPIAGTGPRIPHIQHHRHHQRTERRSNHDGVDQRRAPVEAGHQVQIVLHPGRGQRGLPQRPLHVPVPIRQRAIPPAVHHAEAEPRKQRDRDGDQVEPPGPPPSPAEHVEAHEQCVEDDEEDVQQPIDRQVRHRWFTPPPKVLVTWSVLRPGRPSRNGGAHEVRIPAGNRLKSYRTARSAFPVVLLDLAGPCCESGKNGVVWRESRALVWGTRSDRPSRASGSAAFRCPDPARQAGH